MKIGEGIFDFDKAGQPTGKDMRTAVVLLFVMAATQDGVFVPEELEKICLITERCLGMDRVETAEMIEVAEYCLKEKGTAERLLKRVRSRFSEGQRQRLREMAHEVVSSDQFLSPEEERFMLTIDRYIGS